MSDEPEGQARDEQSSRRWGRRRLLGGVAAATAGAAAAMVAGADPASAAQGGDVVLGDDNTGATHRTGVFSSTENLYATLADPSLKLPGGNNSTYSVGVFGSGPGFGVVGYSANPSSETRTAGVLGTDQTPNTSEPSGNSIGVAAYLYNSANPNPALEAFTYGNGPAISTYTVGEGPAIEAYGYFGSPTLTVGSLGPSAAIAASDTNGTNSGMGPGVTVELTNSENTSTVLEATTAGTGSVVVAQLNNSASTPETPAVAAINQGAGPAVSAVSYHGNALVATAATDDLSAVNAADISSGGGSGVSASSTHGTGVVATSTNGTGLAATSASATGTGVSASNTAGGTALAVDGIATFSRCGKATVPKGASQVTVKNVHLRGASLVLATPQTNEAGVSVQGLVLSVTGSSFDIYLTAEVTAPYPVAWFVVG